MTCECGCGKTLPSKPLHRREPRRFLLGHNPKNGSGWGTKRFRKEPLHGQAPSGLCECGCGEHTPICQETVSRRRHFKGWPLPFKQGHSPQRVGAARKESWKGGRYVHQSGYIYVYAPDSPMANVDGHVLEHRLVMGQVLGRPLTAEEVVHHRDHDRQNNSPENLEVLSRHEHGLEHVDNMLKAQAVSAATSRRRRAA